MDRQARLWRPAESRSIALIAVLAGLSALYLVGAVEADLASGKSHRFGDFFALWSSARIALTRPVGDVYDMARLHEAQLGLGMGEAEVNPFPYPPTFLLAIGGLGWLPFWPALAVWLGVTLLLFLTALCAGLPRPAGLIASALIAPATLCCALSGQSGFLLAALLIGGLRMLPTRPILAGLTFGILTYKPQFGLMVPVALLAAGQWTAILSAGLATAALACLAALVFGTTAWAAWWQMLPGYSAWFDSLPERFPDMRAFLPTVTSSLRMLGAPPALATVGQVAAAVLAALATWTAWRRRPAWLAVPVTIAATALATPHAFIYDWPMLAGAVLIYARGRLDERGGLTSVDVFSMSLVLMIPALMSYPPTQMPIAAAAVAAFLAVMLAADRQGVRPGRGSG